MRAMRLFVCPLLLLALAAWAQSSKSAAPAKVMMGAAHHTMVAAKDLRWKPLAPGFEVATVSGDPDKAGPFTIRIRAAAEAKIPPHWHPTDEHITILEGWFRVGEGDTFDEKGMHEMKAGDYAMMPAKVHHYGAQSKGGVLQVHGMGPFVINWVNPPAAKPDKK